MPNLIDGKFTPSTTSKWIELRNPATQELLGRVPQSTPEEVGDVYTQPAGGLYAPPLTPSIDQDKIDRRPH